MIAAANHFFQVIPEQQQIRAPVVTAQVVNVGAQGWETPV